MKPAQIWCAVLLGMQVAFASAAGEHKPGYGGVVVELKGIQYELVAKPDAVTLYVDDHGKQVPTQGASAKVTLLTGKEKSEVTLAPAGPNKLEAKGKFSITSGTKIVAIVSLQGKAPATMRFTLK